MKDVEKIVDSNGVVMQIVDGAARDMIAAEYDETESYAVGDYCIYDDHYYKCNTAIPSGGETWDATHWDATTLGAEDRAIKSSLEALYTYANSNILWEQVISTSSTSSTNITSVHKGYLALLFDTQDNEVEFYARLRKGYIGDFFQGKVPAYQGNEVILMVPVIPNQIYSLAYRRVNTTGYLKLKVIELY